MHSTHTSEQLLYAVCSRCSESRFHTDQYGAPVLEELVLGKGVKNSFFGGCIGGRDKLEVLREEVVE